MGLQLNLFTKSGTNDLHGSVFEFVRNNWFDARGFYNDVGTTQAPFHQNQFGFELGGPVVIPKIYNGRNKTFFMVNYEGLRNSAATAQLATEFTPLMRERQFFGVTLSCQPKSLLFCTIPSIWRTRHFPETLFPKTCFRSRRWTASSICRLQSLRFPRITIRKRPER